jgi:pimeloyl-ACP methyl ester carboxylesterase
VKPPQPLALDLSPAEVAWVSAPRASVHASAGGRAKRGASLEALTRVTVRGRTAAVAARVPTLLLSGERDALLPPAAARRLADELGGEAAVLAGAPHWLLGSAHWLACASRVHRWLVHRLGEPLLELYAETMAERDEGE